MEHLRKNLKKTFNVYWTHDVSKSNFKISSQAFPLLEDAEAKRDSLRKKHVRMVDNALMISSMGEVIDEIGDASLINELITEMKKDFKVYMQGIESRNNEASQEEIKTDDTAANQSE